jgi:hypothetical protein
MVRILDSRGMFYELFQNEGKYIHIRLLQIWSKMDAVGGAVGRAIGPCRVDSRNPALIRYDWSTTQMPGAGPRPTCQKRTHRIIVFPHSRLHPAGYALPYSRK